MSGWGRARMVTAHGLAYGVRSIEPVASAGMGQAARRAPVILLHGFAGSSEDWEDAAPRIAAAGHAAHAIDLPGHGLTAAACEPARFGPLETARDLALVAESLGLPRAHWLGYSMGGRVALHLALSTPSVVASLALESASPGIADDRERAARRAADDALAAEIESRGTAWFAEYWESLPIFASQSALSEATRAAIRARRLRQSPAGLAGSLRGFGQGAQDHLVPRMSELRCPTLLLSGALDAKYGALAKRMAGAIPNSLNVSIPGAGHNIHLEQPEAFARALLDQLNRVEGVLRREAPLPA